MKTRGERWLGLAIGLVAAVVSLSCVTELMRESDQASIVTGAWTLQRGASLFGQAFYNYDKLYVVYWLLGAVYRVRGMFGGEWSPVLLADRATAVVFWASMLSAIALFSRRRFVPSVTVLVCFLLTPAIFLNSIYVNAAIVSAGFLLLAGVIVEERSVTGDCLAALFFALAVGARADAVLFGPLLVWLRTPSGPWLRGAFRRRPTWLLLGAGVAAMILGHSIYSGVLWNTAFFDGTFRGRMAKTFVAYSAFGLGPSVALLALLATMLARAGKKRGFHLIGVVCLLCPYLFYALQLYSPRYLVLAALSLLVFGVSRRGIALQRLYEKSALWRMGKSGVALAAVVLLVAGINAPSLSHPRPTFSKATLFPSTDGLYPMGAWGSFLLRLREADRAAVDHNQLLWKACQSARFEPAPDGLVHLFVSPMYSYLELAATLRDLRFKAEDTDRGGPLYADSRSLARTGSGLEGTSDSTAGLMGSESQQVSEAYEGISIRRFHAGGDREWAIRTRFLNRLFRANEFRVFDAAKPPSREQLEGRPIVFFAAAPFGVQAGFIHGDGQAQRDAESGLYFVQAPAQVRLEEFRLTGADAGGISLAAQALPAWMSVGQ